MLKIVGSVVIVMTLLRQRSQLAFTIVINSETAIQWCSLKYHGAFKSYSNVKGTYGSRYSRMNQVKFVEDSLLINQLVRARIRN